MSVRASIKDLSPERVNRCRCRCWPALTRTRPVVTYVYEDPNLNGIAFASRLGDELRLCAIYSNRPGTLR